MSSSFWRTAVSLPQPDWTAAPKFAVHCCCVDFDLRQAESSAVLVQSPHDTFKQN